MGNSGVFVNPASKNISKKSGQALNKPNTNLPIFIGEVIDVIYTKNSAGSIKFRSKHNAQIDLEIIDNIAIPLIANIKVYPVKGELVLIFSFGNAYYLPLNFLNNATVNNTPFKFHSNSQVQEDEFNKIHLANKTFDLSKSDVLPTQLNEGDIVLEGRFGQGIKFGSTVKFKDTPQTPYSVSDLSENGDPIIIIRSGIKSEIEDIVKDDSSIYLCSTQKIIVDTGTNGMEGIVGEWSTININSEKYNIESYEYDPPAVEEEILQFQQPISNINTTTIAEAINYTVNKDDLEKLPGRYMSYAAGTPTGMVELYIVDGVPVTNTVASQYLNLKRAAAESGIVLVLNSGFRANEDITMPDGTVKAGQSKLYDKYKTDGTPIAAKPGYSNHQRGNALDINVTNSDTYKWLVQNGLKFGFIRAVNSERWHWEYVPTANSIYAKVPKSSNTWDGFNDGMT